MVNKKFKNHGIKVVRIKERELKKNSKIVLETIKESLPSGKHPRVLDLFAGAGGLSEGFVRVGCEMVGHIEMENNFCNSLITRMVYHALVKMGKFEEYREYVLGKVTLNDLIEKYGLQKERDSVICSKIDKKNYKSLIQQIKDRLDGGRLDFIIGGPPCQAYSHIGRARDDLSMKWDHRKFLYRYYVEFLKELKPKMFIFENVPGLTSSGGGRYLKEMRRLMEEIGYKTDFKKINAAEFGVPQNRRRIILIGWNKKSKLKEYPEFPAVKRDYIVSDFFSDLPKIKAGGGRTVIDEFSESNALLKSLGISNPEFRVLIDHVARPNNGRDLEIYRRAVLEKRKGQNIKYNLLPSRLKTHHNEESFLDRFKVVDDKASGSHTVVAHMGKDGHYYIHPDLSQNRSLTVREAARLQTFPDDYKFEGPRSSQYRQIGNAVPPMLSKVIATEMIKYL